MATIAITSRITDAPLQLARLLSSALGIAPSVAMALIVDSTFHWQELATNPAISPSVVAQLKVARALAAGLGIAPGVVEALVNPRALAAEPAIAPAVASVLTNPKALAAAVGITPSAAAALTNARALAAALGVTPAVAMELTLPFTSPLAISGCVAWFDMQDAASYTNTAGAISAITNKASGVSWTEAGSTQRPTYNATGINSKPAMDFDGVNDRIISSESAVISALGVANSHTIFYVAAFDTLDRADSLFAIANSGGSLGIRSWGQSTTGAGRWGMTTLTDASTVASVDSTTASSTGVHVHCWHASPSQMSFQLDNGAADPSNAAHAPSATTSDRVSLGCRPRSTPTLFFDGRLGELIVYNSRLSAANIATVASYLATRWA